MTKFNHGISRRSVIATGIAGVSSLALNSFAFVKVVRDLSPTMMR